MNCVTEAFLSLCTGMYRLKNTAVNSILVVVIESHYCNLICE